MLVSLFDLSQTYYTFLRIVVTLSAVIILLNEVKNDVNLIGIGFILIVLIFNPILPLSFNIKLLLIPIHLISATLFLKYAYKLNTK